MNLRLKCNDQLAFVVLWIYVHTLVSQMKVEFLNLVPLRWSPNEIVKEWAISINETKVQKDASVVPLQQ